MINAKNKLLTTAAILVCGREGVGAAVLVGGGDKSFSLQPLALEGSTGLGLSGGVGYLYIEPASR